jgi:hypothetical protein
LEKLENPPRFGAFNTGQFTPNCPYVFRRKKMDKRKMKKVFLTFLVVLGAAGLITGSAEAPVPSGALNKSRRALYAEEFL